MKAFLMFRDRDFDPAQKLPPNAGDLVTDLGLDTLFDAMAAGDPFVREVAATGVLASLHRADEIAYRQAVLRDCLEHPNVVRELYRTALDGIEQERKAYRYFRSPDGILDSSGRVVDLLMTYLRRLREIADTSAHLFGSDGFGTFFRMLATDLDDDYFRTVDDQLKRLKFRQGVVVSARLGTGNAGVDLVLRRPPDDSGRSLRQWLSRAEPESLTLQIADQDDSGTQALSELRERGLNLVASAIAQSADHITAFSRWCAVNSRSMSAASTCTSGCRPRVNRCASPPWPSLAGSSCPPAACTTRA